MIRTNESQLRLKTGPSVPPFSRSRMSEKFKAVIGCLVFVALLIAAAAHARGERCHGENGIPQDKHFPVIWGQHQGYLYLQLRDFKRGTRKSDAMTPFVEHMERDDIMALAEYFAKKPWPDLR